MTSARCRELIVPEDFTSRSPSAKGNAGFPAHEADGLVGIERRDGATQFGGESLRRDIDAKDALTYPIGCCAVAR